MISQKMPILLGLLSILLLPLPGTADEGASTGEQLGRQLASLTSASPEDTAALMRELLGQIQGDEPTEFWDALLSKVDFSELEHLMAAIYSKHLSEEEMRAAIAFFSTPEGRSWTAKQPALASDIMLATQQWLQPALAEVIEQAENGEFPESSLGDKARMEKTVRDMRNVGVAMMSWLTDQVVGSDQSLSLSDPQADEAFWSVHKEGRDSQKYRRISHGQLEALLVPIYIDEIPEHDGWGHAFEFAINSDLLASFVLGLRSPGKDGQFETDDHEIGPFPIDDVDRDIVWIDGYFARWPQ